MAYKKRSLFLTTICATLIGLPMVKQTHAEMPPTLNFSGVPGVIDMPSGETMPDGAFSISASRFGPISRGTISFQITPWMSGSFRLQNTGDWQQLFPDSRYGSYNDRSFDLRFRLLEESQYLPSVTLGLQDFIGTSLNSAEYLAATKTFGDRLKVTAGVGWGRLGSYKPFSAPFGERPEVFIPGQLGGKPNGSAWFKGDAAFFGGVEYQVNENWSLKAEYSSDAYPIETALRSDLVGKEPVFERKSPYNFGVEYKWGDHIRVGAYSMYGEEVGFSFHMVMDPKNRPGTIGIMGSGPIPIGHRPSRGADPEAYDKGWVTQADANALLRKNLTRYLEKDGIKIEDFAYTADRAQIRINNSKIDAASQAVGRTARALSQVMPASVEIFEIVPVVKGLPASKVTMRRSDLEKLEYQPNSGARLREGVSISDAGSMIPGGLGPDPELYPKFTWGVLPAYRVSAPTRGDIGIRATASYDFAPGWVASGTIYQRLADNFDKVNVYEKDNTGNLPPVRSDTRKYNQDSSTSLERATLAYYAHPAENIYTRVTFGYLERMQGGVSGEVLWKKANSPFALGLELNYTKQRDTNGGFGFGYMRSDKEGDPEYHYEHSAVTGHVSAYYDFGNGYLGQLDVGRYLAGDVGATVSLDREFANGWKVGAFATFTDASEEDFGEGSFDKGIRINIPMNWVLGNTTRREISQTIRPLQRDGGARVDVEGRLYETIRDYHQDRVDDQWDRVWR